MEIKGERVEISPVPAYDDRGQHLEPEQHPVQHVVQATAPVALTQSGSTGHSLPGVFVHETTAGAVAAALRHHCGICRSFDQPAAQKYIEARRSSYEGQVEIANMMGILMSTFDPELRERHAGADGDIDTDAALNALGICHVLTEVEKDVVLVHPLSACPAKLIGPSAPEGAFVPVDSAEHRQATAEFDAIMCRAAAAGKS